jgi:hypothetical protein
MEIADPDVMVDLCSVIYQKESQIRYMLEGEQRLYMIIIANFIDDPIYIGLPMMVVARELRPAPSKFSCIDLTGRQKSFT